MVKKRFFIETYGCQMNFSDSEIVASVLKDHFYEFEPNLKKTNLILINTCAIREHAEQRVWNRLEHLKALKLKNKNLVVGLLGCMAERLKDELFAGGVVDLVVGPDAYRELPKLIESIQAGSKAFNIVLSAEETYADINPVRLDTNDVSAFISIMRGCQNYCSYCVVPYTRGKERSRAPETIVAEAQQLFADGFREITLLGQNVNSYNYNGVGFAQLIAQVAAVDPQLRIRYATSHPKDLTDELIATLTKHPNICNSIHLPMQSGSDAVLSRMNRNYTRQFYLNRIQALRKAMPHCSISTDIIAGFCGETEADHQDTLSAMRLAHFDYAFMFKYSERGGTRAAEQFADDVPEQTKAKRLNEIIALQHQLSLESNKKDLQQSMLVLIEGVSKRSKTQLWGRTAHNKVVVFTDLQHTAGHYVLVKITDCTSATLMGEVVSF
ncbi:MAG: tRNA (N6-isopentenyl adenosine(37)-C2)-methylthiotransferase MiaB [Bacteroidota bacterium]